MQDDIGAMLPRRTREPENRGEDTVHLGLPPGQHNGLQRVFGIYDFGNVRGLLFCLITFNQDKPGSSAPQLELGHALSEVSRQVQRFNVHSR